MKNYLADFFRRFGYEEEDASFLLGAYSQIEENEVANKAWLSMMDGYENDINACVYDVIKDRLDETACASEVHRYTVDLLAYICFSKHLKHLYELKGLPLDVWHNSMLDLKYKLEECKLVKGIRGSFVAPWFSGFFILNRFALGRLQFENSPFEGEYDKHGVHLKDGDNVVAVHIPRTKTPFDKKSVDEAFHLAKEFFYPQSEKAVFICHSWLLFPENDALLSEKSNIRNFASRFDILSSGCDEDLSEIWRLYDTDEKQIDKLPCDSSLRLNYVEHFKRGGRFGWGYGVYVLS